MSNYFNTLPLRDQLHQLAQCRFMDADEFTDGISALKDKKIVIVGCGAQGLNQGFKSALIEAKSASVKTPAACRNLSWPSKTS